MLDIANTIRSLSDFNRNTSELLNRLTKTGSPLVLTINGMAEIIVQDAHGYYGRGHHTYRVFRAGGSGRRTGLMLLPDLVNTSHRLTKVSLAGAFSRLTLRAWQASPQLEPRVSCYIAATVGASPPACTRARALLAVDTDVRTCAPVGNFKESGS
jgi:hypothetical protein